MSTIAWIAAALALAAVWQATTCVRCLRRRQPAAATLRAGSTLVLLAPLVALALVAAHLYTWHRLTAEETVAELAVAHVDGDRYRVTLTRADATEPGSYPLRGDDWRLEARVLRWRSTGELLGLDTRYRLERLAGRYRDTERARREPASVHDLTAPSLRPLETVGAGLLRYLPLADARYGSATYLPLSDGARYRVSIGRDGLIARPVNAVAEAAVERRFP